MVRVAGTPLNTECIADTDHLARDGNGRADRS